MARRSNVGTDSLDLLLDTICNVFGGIILMAILVEMQTQSTAARMPEPKAEDTQRALEAQRLRFECEGLSSRATSLAEQQKGMVQAYPVTPNGMELANRVMEFRKGVTEANKRVTDTDATVVTSRRGKSEAADLIRTVESKLKDVQAEVRSLEREMQQLSSAPSKQVRLPHRQGLALGQACYFVVKGGRVYSLDPGHDIEWYGGRQRLGQCIVEPLGLFGGGQNAKVEPIDGDGFPVIDDAKGLAAFMRWMSRCPSEGHYVVFFTFGDSKSFAAFQVAKDAVVAARYRYSTEYPVLPGEDLIIVPAHGHETE
jgi:hypothetical protein